MKTTPQLGTLKKMLRQKLKALDKLLEEASRMSNDTLYDAADVEDYIQGLQDLLHNMEPVASKVYLLDDETEKLILQISEIEDARLRKALAEQDTPMRGKKRKK